MNIGKPKIRQSVKLSGKIEEIAPAKKAESVEPDAQLQLEKDMSDNSSEYERGYQVGYNRAIELANMELARRRSFRNKPIEPGPPAHAQGILDIQDRRLR